MSMTSSFEKKALWDMIPRSLSIEGYSSRVQAALTRYEVFERTYEAQHKELAWLEAIYGDADEAKEYKRLLSLATPRVEAMKRPVKIIAGNNHKKEKHADIVNNPVQWVASWKASKNLKREMKTLAILNARIDAITQKARASQGFLAFAPASVPMSDLTTAPVSSEEEQSVDRNVSSESENNDSETPHHEVAAPRFVSEQVRAACDTISTQFSWLFNAVSTANDAPDSTKPSTGKVPLSAGEQIGIAVGQIVATVLSGAITSGVAGQGISIAKEGHKLAVNDDTRKQNDENRKAEMHTIKLDKARAEADIAKAQLDAQRMKAAQVDKPSSSGRADDDQGGDTAPPPSPPPTLPNPGKAHISDLQTPTVTAERIAAVELAIAEIKDLLLQAIAPHPAPSLTAGPTSEPPNTASANPSILPWQNHVTSADALAAANGRDGPSRTTAAATSTISDSAIDMPVDKGKGRAREYDDLPGFTHPPSRRSDTIATIHEAEEIEQDTDSMQYDGSPPEAILTNTGQHIDESSNVEEIEARLRAVAEMQNRVEARAVDGELEKRFARIRRRRSCPAVQQHSGNVSSGTRGAGRDMRMWEGGEEAFEMDDLRGRGGGGGMDVGYDHEDGVDGE